MSTGQDYLVRPTTAGAGSRSARGIAWNLGTHGVGFAVRLVSIPVLARLLSPDDYGLVAMVTAVTGLVAVLGTLGVSEAVIQSRQLTHEQATGLFWVNVSVGAVLAALTAIASPLLATLYDRPEVAAITAVSAIGFFIAGCGVQHNALMLRRLMHRRVALQQLAAVFLGIVAAVVAALAGAGYWALVIQALVQPLASVVMAWIAVPWRPGRPRRRAGIRRMLSFGGGVSSFQLLNYLARNADNVLIGTFLGASQLGLYGRAYSLLTAPLQQIHSPVGLVIRPTLAALWTEPERYRRHYTAVLRGLCYVCMPLVLVTAVLADPVVRVVLGDPWAPSADVFRWLAIVGFVQTVGYTNGWLYASSGRAWQWARWALISRPVIVLAFVVGLQWGIEGVAIAYAAAETVLTPIGIVLAGRTTPVSLRDVLAAASRPATLAVAAAGAALPVVLLLDAGPVVVLAAGLGAALLVLLLGFTVWPRVRRDVGEMRQVLLKRG